jgi:hypothetical protein
MIVLTFHSSVPTQNQVLVPETLLKKRKSQEAARAERSSHREWCYASCSWEGSVSMWDRGKLTFLVFSASAGQTVLTFHSSVPTQNQVLVPETLLKKRKSQEAARS